MKRTCGVVLSLVLAAPLLAGSPPVEDQEKVAIEKTVLDYLEGWYTGDAARMERALHPELVKRMVGADPTSGRGFLQPIGASAMVVFTAAGAGKPKAGVEPGIEVTVLDVFQHIAMVRAKSVHFMDYVQLGKLDGQWRIVNVLWERMPAPPPPPAPK